MRPNCISVERNRLLFNETLSTFDGFHRFYTSFLHCYIVQHRTIHGTPGESHQSFRNSCLDCFRCRETPHPSRYSHDAPVKLMPEYRSGVYVRIVFTRVYAVIGTKTSSTQKMAGGSTHVPFLDTGHDWGSKLKTLGSDFILRFGPITLFCKAYPS